MDFLNNQNVKITQVYKMKINHIQRLVNWLNECRDKYYNESISLIDDLEYDMLFDTLVQLEQETNYVIANSPTATVGYDVKSELNTVKHTHPMLSLNKCHSVDEVIKFKRDKDLIAMFKMDGLTITAEYNDGVLTRLEKRGNGIEGDDVLFHARSFENLPITINVKGKYTIDGEAIITYEDFDKINSELPDDKKYANPRNLASGTLNLLDANVSAKRHLKFIAWDVIEGDDSELLSTKLLHASYLGFTSVLNTVISSNDKDKIKDEINVARQSARENSYPIDGIVFKYNDVSYGKTLGSTSHHFNNGIAYKFEDDRYPTKLVGVEWTMGKTGSLCPTIITEPVEIDGTIVERASVHNVSIFKQLNLTEGCTCMLYKANMIIPQCDYTIDNGGTKIEIPTTCPICNEPTVITKENNSEVLTCSNPDCKGKLLGKLVQFVSKNGMNIDGLSEETLNTLINAGYITDLISVYKLYNYKDKLLQLNRFGKKKVDNLLNAIEKSKTVKLSNFICALSIPLIGRTASKDISNFVNADIDKFIDLIGYSETNKFLSIQGFGSTMVKSLDKWLEHYEDKLYELKNILTFVKPTVKSSTLDKSVDLKGSTFVITGSLNIFKNRNEAVEMITNCNGKVSGSVSKNTNYLVNNDIDSTTSKNTKAKSLGVPIITEQQLYDMLNK